MDINSIYTFLFETYAGIGILVGAGLVISLITAVIMELRTRKTFVDRGERSEDDEWSFFDDDDDEDTDDAEGEN